MRLLQGELLKLVRRPATVVVLGVLLVLLVVVYLMLGAVAQSPTAGSPASRAAIRLLLTFPGAYGGVLSLIVGLGGLFAVAFGAAVAGADWAWGMVKVAVSRGESRSRYAIAKLLAVVIVLVPGLLIAFVVGVAAATTAASLAGIGTAGLDDPERLRQLPEQLARCWWAIVEQAALGFAVATLTRSQLAGIGAGIALYFLEQFAAAFLPEYVRYLPFDVATSFALGARVVVDTGQSSAVGRLVIDASTAFVLVTAYVVAATVLAGVATERAEITE